MINRRIVLALLAGLGSMGGQAALADNGAAPVRLRGTIEAIGPDGLDLTTRAGDKVHVAMSDKTRVSALVKGSFADIKPDSYIGSAALAQADGTLKAMEVTVFPPAMRGTGQGQFPWDTAPSSSMTNGVVGDLVGTDGHTMTVKYGTGEARIVVSDATPVVRVEPADRSAIAAGAKAFVVGVPAADGTMTAAFVAVGKDGLTPPM